MQLPPRLEGLLKHLPSSAQPYLVGGCVRDWILGITVKDYDLEVFNISAKGLRQILENHGRTDTVGRCFGVIKWTPCKGETYDIALPRREIKKGKGHRGFTIFPDPELSTQEAASRRDYTVNAIMYDPARKTLLDHFGGIEDLQNLVLRHTSPAFTEDPLRVLRGMQFAGRFGMKGHPKTMALCRSIKHQFRDLSLERVWEEWRKWASQSSRPSMGLHFLKNSGWLEYFPELEDTIGTPQDPEWHPEGDVWQHTCHCCDALTKLPDWKTTKLPLNKVVWMMATLLHDAGKPSTTEKAEKNGRMRIVSPGHDQKSVDLAKTFFRRIKAPKTVQERVIPLIAQHMIYTKNITDRAVRRLSHRLLPETIPSLCTLMSADAMGRPPASQALPEHIEKLRKKASQLDVLSKAPRPFLTGHDLLKEGFKPGKRLGMLLRQAYDLQMEGAIESRPAALEWMRQQGIQDPCRLTP
ncbi:MAG: HD domain-containing protein [Verrucomicrobiota bacterium]|nr:HD domain-containing protein [Verrucomicrobiota bacterium]MDG1892628.1 HD domain-containing protein [Verrucomicrobiota bacterium]